VVCPYCSLCFNRCYGKAAAASLDTRAASEPIRKLIAATLPPIPAPEDSPAPKGGEGPNGEGVGWGERGTGRGEEGQEGQEGPGEGAKEASSGANGVGEAGERGRGNGRGWGTEQECSHQWDQWGQEQGQGQGQGGWVWETEGGPVLALHLCRALQSQGQGAGLPGHQAPSERLPRGQTYSDSLLGVH